MRNGIGFTNPGSGAHLPLGGEIDPPQRKPNFEPFLNLISQYESGGDYNAIFGQWQKSGSKYPQMEVSTKSVAELDQFSRRHDSRGYGLAVQFAMKNLADDNPLKWPADKTDISTPMGRFQIVGNTLRRLSKKLNISPEAIFTPELQDRFFRELVKETFEKFSTLKSRRDGLRGVWEGFKKASDEELDSAIAAYEDGKKNELISIASMNHIYDPSADLQNGMDLGGPIQGVNLFDGTPTESAFIPQARDATVFEEVSAAFALENDLWNGYQLISYNVEKDSFKDDPDFDLTIEMLEGTVLENRLGLVADIRSNEELDFVMNWHQRELKHRAVIEGAGWSGIGWSMAAGIASPISLMPFGAGRAAASGFRGIIKGARAGAAGVGVSEVILQANQEYRTATETALGIGGGMILMGALGGLGGAVGRSQFRRASAQADLLMSDRVQAVVDDGEFSYVSNDAVRAEVRRQQEETGNAFFSTGDDANSTARLKTIFKELGDKVESENVAGHLDNDRRLLVSGETLNNSRNVIAGFDADIDPKHFKAYHQEQMLDRKAMSEAYEEASTTPIQSSNLTPGQQKLSELETTHAAREETLARKLTELRERLHNSKLPKGHKDKIWLKKEERDALYQEMEDINEDLRLGRLQAAEEIAEVKATVKPEEQNVSVWPKRETEASRLAGEEASTQTARQEAALVLQEKLQAAREAGVSSTGKPDADVVARLDELETEISRLQAEDARGGRADLDEDEIFELDRQLDALEDEAQDVRDFLQEWEETYPTATRQVDEVEADIATAKEDLRQAEFAYEEVTPTNRESVVGILNKEQIKVAQLEEELAALNLTAKEAGDKAVADLILDTPDFFDDFMAKHEAWQQARKTRKLAERERKKANRQVDDEEIPVDVEEPAAPGRSVEEIEKELAEARFDLDNQRFKPKKKTKKHIAKNAQEAQRVKDLEDELLLASDPLAHGVKELEKKLSQLEARIKKKSVGPKQRAQMLEEMQELREEIIEIVQGESLGKDLRKVDGLEPTAPKKTAPTTAKGSDRVSDSRSRTGTLSRASVNALGEELVEELGFVNGLIREITELFEIQAPTNLQRARMVYLRRQFSEWATEERFLRLQRIYKEHNMDDAEIKQMFNHPLKGSVFEDLLVLEKLESGGDVRSRVDRLILNDKELHGVNEAPDTTPLRSIHGIGPKLEKRLQDYGINDVGELRQYLLNGGEKIEGLHKAIQERVLNSEIPGELGDAHIPLNDTPAMRAAEAAWGANNLPLMISTPQGRIMMRSDSPEAHRIMANLIITDYKLTRNYQGIEAEEPAELGIKNWHIKISNTVSKIEGLRRQYLLSVRFDSKEVPGRVKTFAKRFTDDEVAARNKVLPQSRWWVEVTKALRHGNQAGLRVPEEAVKYIEQAARLVRDEIWGPASAEFGYLSKELGTKGINPMNYVMRVYDVVKVRQDEPKFRAAMLEDVLKNWNRNYGSAPDAKQIAEIHETVDKWITGILTEPHMRSAPNLAEVSIANRVSFGRGARKRVVEVSDDVLEPYLKHDFRDIISAYMHTRIPDLELKNKFGDVKMKAAFDQLDAGYLARIEKAPETLKEGEQARGLNPAQHLQRRARTKSELEAQWKSDRRDLEAMRDIMRNTYTLPADPYTWKGYTERGMKMLRDINFLRIGGGFAITALGDIGGMVLVNGISRTMGDLIGELAHGIGRAHESVPMQKADLEALGLSWNDVLNQRAISWSGVGEYGSGGYTALERALSLGSKKMATVSLLQPWTNYMKQIAARSVMSRMIDVAEAVEKGTFKADDLAAISRAYMGKEDLLNMLKLYRAFGGEGGGSKWLGIEKWQDTADITNVLEMKRLVRNVIIADTDRAVMTPGVGDSPLFMHSTHGKFLLQFKRFGIAHTQRLLVPAMQGAKADNLIILNVAAISVGLGAMVYSIKEMVNKREAPTDIGRIIQEGVVRSDLWGSLGEMDGISSAVTGGSMGFRQALGPDTYHSYHGPNYFDGVASMGLGASYSTIKEGIKAGSGIYDGLTGGGLDDMSAGQMRAFRRMMPYQNLFYLDFIFDYAQNGMEEAGKRAARFKELANGMQSQ